MTLKFDTKIIISHFILLSTIKLNLFFFFKNRHFSTVGHSNVTFILTFISPFSGGFLFENKLKNLLKRVDIKYYA